MLFLDLPGLKNSYLEKISQSGNLLLNLVNSALLISKYENKKLELYPEPVSWSELIQEIEVTIRGMANKKGILFTVDSIGEPIGFVTVDKLNLQKIILNLLSNAVNFTNEGGNVSLLYEKLAQPVGKNTAKIMVRDTGIGMSKSFMARMYEPFMQEKSTSIKGTSGAGLGLSIVKKLVELMGGHIEVVSELGRGTEFTVDLPIQECASPVKSFSDAPKNDVHGPDNPFFGMRILLCEDNEMNKEIAVSLLESKNIIVDIAVNGKEGISKFANSKEDTYNVVLMDLRMPVMDGYTASRSIRSLNRNDAKQIPIIALTADAFDDDKEQCIAAGMNAHVS
jgi:CheY-like chemotaxis protein